MSRLLVVVDYQKDFVDGTLGFPKAIQLEPYIMEKIQSYEHSHDEVVFTRDLHQANYLTTVEGIHLPIEHCIQGTPGADIFGRVGQASKNHRVFDKATFGSDKLFDYIRSHPFEEIVLLGIVSNICVLSNAVLAKSAQPNSKIIVDSKGSASYDLKLEMEGYDILRNLHIEVH